MLATAKDFEPAPQHEIWFSFNFYQEFANKDDPSQFDIEELICNHKWAESVKQVQSIREAKEKVSFLTSNLETVATSLNEKMQKKGWVIVSILKTSVRKSILGTMTRNYSVSFRKIVPDYFAEIPF